MTTAGSTSRAEVAVLYNHNESQGEPLPPHQVIKAALSAEIISADDLVNRRVRVEQMGRSHSVYQVFLNEQPFAFIKSFGPSRGETDGQIEREYAIAELAKSRPEVARLIAPTLNWKAPAPIIASRAVAGLQAWTTDQHGGGSQTHDLAWGQLVDCISQPLAMFHYATRDIAQNKAQDHPAFKSQLPWIFKIFSGDAPADLWNNPGLKSLLNEAANLPALSDGIRQARSEWRVMSLIHADLKHDNVLIGEGWLTIIDWEMARIGDPAWDLAGLACRVLLVANEGEPWGGDEHKHVAYLLKQYCLHTPISKTALATRLVSYLGAWLFMCAIQHQSTLAAEDDNAKQMLEKSRYIFAQRKAIINTLLEKIR